MTEKNYKPKMHIKLERFDWLSVKTEIRQVATSFEKYLDTVPIRGTTRYALMGPVGKLLSQATIHPFPDKSLVLNELIVTHEGGRKYPISLSSKDYMEQAAEHFVTLLEKVPATRRNKVCEVLADMIYADRRLSNLDFFKERNVYILKKLSSDEVQTLKKNGITEAKIISKNLLRQLKDDVLQKKIYSLLDDFAKSQGYDTIDEEEETPSQTNEIE